MGSQDPARAVRVSGRRPTDGGTTMRFFVWLADLLSITGTKAHDRAIQQEHAARCNRGLYAGSDGRCVICGERS